MKNINLWYKQEAKEWNDALPIGNGRIGAMIFGKTDLERVQFNEDTLWSGCPSDNNNYEAVNYLEQARKYIFEEKYSDAQNLIHKKMLGAWGESYLPMGDIYFEFGHKNVSNYIRELSLDNATVNVTYNYDGVNFKREAFATALQNVIIYRFSANTAGKIAFNMKMSSLLKYETTAKDGELIMQGCCPDHVEPNYVKNSPNPIVYNENSQSIKFCAIAKIILKGGKSEITNNEIKVTGADEAIVVLSLANSFNGYDKNPITDGKNAFSECEKYLKNVLKYSYEEMKNAHIEDYSKYFGRVALKINAEDNQNNHIPTDKRIEKIKGGNYDIGLVTLLFQYGRYLLIACSREGTQAANLQGIWNEELRAPWSSNYTTNINTQMNYWHSQTCNLAECNMPLVDLIEDLSKVGQKTAQVHFNCDGWCANHNVDLWRNTSPVGKNEEFAKYAVRYAFWPMSGIWFCRHLWEHYEFGMDKNYLLNTAYPIIKGAVLFALDWLVEHNGYLVTCPSTSPENTFIDENGEMVGVSFASAMDMFLIKDLFNIFLKCQQVSSLDEALKNKVEASLKRLYPAKIGSFGQLLEWPYEYKEHEPGHRHVSMLYPIYPADLITPYKDKEFNEAAKKILIHRLENGGGHTGWSCAWIISLWARFLDGEMANKYTNMLLEKSICNNLFDLHPPFQIDGNFGFSAAIGEMLIQSHEDFINLLPAIPSAWKSGEFKGLCARGGFEINLVWDNFEIKKVSILSKAGMPCILKSKYNLPNSSMDENGLYTLKFETKSNELYNISD